uniref:Bm2386 n=1 Tax=Brugia malayi TaxID=6279 RepID=A0A1I9G319_BRUMA|nr:Bm2386 [Brugia malayi]
MLENLVAWVLNNYVGEYLENLNTDQLSIALLQGQVELENVPLKKSALRKFDIPLKVKSGLLGKLTLSVPLTRLRSEPWVIKMSDLLVLLEPSTSVRYDVENVEIYEQAKKEQQLEDLEKYHKRQLLSYWGLPSPDSASEQNWWGASLVSTIVNNIQLVLTNVHIRYEDDVTLSNNIPFVCGVRIHNVSMQTTNSHWETGYMQPRDGVNMFKKLGIEGLSVYWNCGQRVTGEIKSYMDLQYMMAPEISKDNVCILQPFSAHLYMERNTNKFPLKTYPYIPRFKFNLCPEKVVIELTKRQLLEMSSLGKEWARFDRSRQHRKWRPLTTVGENAKEWWNFAYNRVQDQERQRKIRHTWSFAYNRAKQLNSYCRAYRRRLLSYLETSAISVCPVLYSFLCYCFQKILKVEDEILDVLNESRDDSTILHRDTLLAEVKLKLERMTIRFIEDFENRKDGSTRVLAMDLWQLASCVHLSPRRHSTAVSLSVKDLSLQRLCTFPAEDTLIDNTQDAYHRRAPKMTVTHTLDVKCSELSVLYNEGAFDDLATFFSDKSTIKQVRKQPLFINENCVLLVDFVISFNGECFYSLTQKLKNQQVFLTTAVIFKVKIDFGSLEVKDLFEPTSDELLCIRSQTSLKVFVNYYI